MRKKTKNKKWSTLNINPKTNRQFSKKDVNVDNAFDRTVDSIGSYLLQEFTSVVELICFTIAAAAPVFIIILYTLITWMVYHYLFSSPFVIFFSLWFFFKYVFAKPY